LRLPAIKSVRRAVEPPDVHEIIRSIEGDKKRSFFFPEKGSLDPG
jgi:hypothetical protein